MTPTMYERQDVSEDLLKWQVELYVDTYRHHWEMFIKAITLYVVAMGAIGGYVFGASAGDPSLRSVIALAASVVSVFALWCFILSYRWVQYADVSLNGAMRSLGLPDFSLRVAKQIIVVALVLAITTFVGGIIAFVLLRPAVASAKPPSAALPANLRIEPTRGGVLSRAAHSNR
jgi:hypothetical protein